MSEIIYKEIVNGVEIAVRETQQCIILEFDGVLNQTSLKKKYPHELQKTYAKEMVEVLQYRKTLPFLPTVEQRALVLGTGGGVIPSYLHRNTQMNITSVDIFDLRHIGETYFHMPNDDRITCVIGDAFEFVETCTTQYDYIFVDIAGPKGMPEEIRSTEFYENLNKINKGYIAFNAFVTQRNYEHYIKGLRHSFSNVHEQYKRLGRYSKNHIAFCNDD
tara:strand:- start:564 stop:1217 length:654 start_codon:yes stop_codon:yes gene_type:complete